MSASFTLDTRAASGFSNASDYDKHRPSYPPQVVETLLTHLNLKGVKGAKIIDLACGTGKFTELLANREEGYEVLGIEPHEGMRGELVRKGLEGVTVFEGDAGDMKVGEGWADGVVAAQAFHWFATRESLKEIHRVLKPGTVFGMVWNVEDYNAPKEWSCASRWEQTLKDIIVSLEDGHPRFRHGQWKEVFESQMETSPFQTIKDTITHNLPNFSLPIGEEDVEWTIYLPNEAIWSRYLTLSQIANLEGEKLKEVKAEVFRALKEEDVERNAAGEVALHGRTHLAWTSRV